MHLTHYQVNLLHEMLRSIQDFKNGQILFSNLTDSLQGTFYAIEFQNESLINQWHDKWNPLEILSAVKGDDVSLNEVQRDLIALEIFIRSCISAAR